MPHLATFSLGSLVMPHHEERIEQEQFAQEHRIIIKKEVETIVSQE